MEIESNLLLILQYRLSKAENTTFVQQTHSTDELWG
jgi:hypothetical protein